MKIFCTSAPTSVSFIPPAVGKTDLPPVDQPCCLPGAMKRVQRSSQKVKFYTLLGKLTVEHIVHIHRRIYEDHMQNKSKDVYADNNSNSNASSTSFYAAELKVATRKVA